MKPRLHDDHLRAWRGLLNAHHALVRRIDADLAAADGLPLEWYDVLLELYNAPDRWLRVGELGERVVLTRSGISRLVTRLEQEGLVEKQAVEGDARGVAVVLTAKGEAAFRRTWPLYASGIQRHFAGHLSRTTARRLIAAFDDLLSTRESGVFRTPL